MSQYYYILSRRRYLIWGSSELNAEISSVLCICFDLRIGTFHPQAKISFQVASDVN